MNRIFKSSSWAVVFVFIFSIFAISSAAQKMDRGPVPPFWGDTTINPHDFTNRYYQNNGVKPKDILARRTGSDSYSVFGYTSDPNRTDVRVLITVPAYTLSGEVVYWYPLGEVTDTGFTDTKAGFLARETAKLFPIYVFPGKDDAGPYTFAGSRQAPLIDNSWAIYSQDRNFNPLGLRQIVVVNYTEKAFNTKDGMEMMEYLGQKNGLAADDTPLIRSVEDIHYMLKNECITADTRAGDKGVSGIYAISPIIKDPTGGVIARDAYIWMTTKDGKPLMGELMFVTQFQCLKDYGSLCY